MAEIQYFASADESIALATFIASAFDASIHVDESPTPVPRVVNTAGGIAELFATSLPIPLLHVTSPVWGRLPLTTTEVHANDGRHFFAVDQRYGGPAFIWSVPRTMQTQGQHLLTAGIFGDWPTYYARKGSSEAFARPPSMAYAFLAVTKRIRVGAIHTRWKSSRRTGPWLSPGARSLLDNGYELAVADLEAPARPLTAGSSRTRGRRTARP